MVFISGIEKAPISLNEVENILKVLGKLVTLHGLKEPIIEYLVIVNYREIVSHCSKKEYIAIDDKACISNGLIILCGDVLSNVFIEELMRAYYALGMWETYTSINLESLDRFVRENLLDVLFSLKKNL